MRVTSGQWAGRPIKAPKGNNTRPTSDRVRQSLFNILHHGTDNDGAPIFDGFEASHVLDAYCGTGALGIEALSNGAEFCYFCDKAQDALKITTANIDALQANGKCIIAKHDSTKHYDIGRREFDLVFIDPPYGRGFGTSTLINLRDSGVLSTDALCIVESDIKKPEIIPTGFSVLDERLYGSTKIEFIRFTG